MCHVFYISFLLEFPWHCCSEGHTLYSILFYRKKQKCGEAKATCPRPYGYEVSLQKLWFAISVLLLLGSKCSWMCSCWRLFYHSHGGLCGANITIALLTGNWVLLLLNMMSNIHNHVTIHPFPLSMKAVLWHVTNFNILLQGMHFTSVNKTSSHLPIRQTVHSIAY